MYYTFLTVIIIFSSSVLSLPAVAQQETNLQDGRDIEDFMAAVEDVLTGAISNVSTAIIENGALDDYNTSTVIQSAIEIITNLWTSENNPIQVLLAAVESYAEYFLSFFVTEKSRSSPLAVVGYGVMFLAILGSIFPLIYLGSYLAGKYIIAPLVISPFQSRGHFGRSLEDVQMLDSPSDGVMKALETYNLLQSLNGEF